MPRRGRAPDHPHLTVGPCRQGDNPWMFGTWCSSAREEMDAAFRAAMQREIAAGTEHCATSPSTCFGTKAPRVLGPEDFASHKDVSVPPRGKRAGELEAVSQCAK
jgi:hypothetical protein